MAIAVEKQQEETQVQGSETGGIGSPISNEAYDVIAALHSKLEGLEAYRKYAQDGNTEVWRELTQIDIKGVEKLCNELEQLVKDGRLRMQEPGETGH